MDDCFGPRDLLEPKSDNLQLHEDKARGVYIGDVKELTLKRSEDAVGLISGAVRGRAVGSTLMNADSSRSHLVVLLTVEARSPSHSEAGGVLCRTGKARPPLAQPSIPLAAALRVMRADLGRQLNVPSILLCRCAWLTWRGARR